MKRLQYQLNSAMSQNIPPLIPLFDRDRQTISKKMSEKKQLELMDMYNQSNIHLVESSVKLFLQRVEKGENPNPNLETCIAKGVIQDNPFKTKEWQE